MGDSVPDGLHVLLLSLLRQGLDMSWTVHRGLWACGRTPERPLCSFVFLQQMKMSDQRLGLVSETDWRMGTEVVFLSPLCNIMYVWFAGSTFKCYFYLEVLKKQNVKTQAFCYFSMFVWRKGAFFFITCFELNSCNADCSTFLIISLLIINWLYLWQKKSIFHWFLIILC